MCSKWITSVRTSCEHHINLLILKKLANSGRKWKRRKLLEYKLKPIHGIYNIFVLNSKEIHIRGIMLEYEIYSWDFNYQPSWILNITIIYLLSSVIIKIKNNKTWPDKKSELNLP